ncbi:MAG: multicopper oxidase domain-containing protein [Acidobacteria bacterium]|nr:multicopper oxidase domain-containing protein [Acidobacteriota bacterium]
MPSCWTRREALLGAAALLTATRSSAQLPGDPSLDARSLTSFVDPLPLPELLKATSPNHYAITMQPRLSRLHRDLPLTRAWSYGSSAVPPLIEARKDQPTTVEWINALPETPLISHQGFMVMDAHPGESPCRTSPHLHGAHVDTKNDGFPENWFAPGHSYTCHYPNAQDAMALWFHDHAMGVNRFNIYAGLSGMYLLRDEQEAALNLPRGKYEIPLMLCDRILTKDAQLYYPNPEQTGDEEDEFYGDAMLVNGKIQPFCDVEARRYRLRLFNTANARTFPLQFSNHLPFHIIGSDQGLLAAPVATTRFDLAPGERADVIVDFSQTRGETFQLIGDGFDLMQFRVSAQRSQDESTLPKQLRTITRIAENTATRTRLLTLAEYGENMVMLLNGKFWHEPVTEIVQAGSTEIWQLANLSDDMHPIHLHAVRFQILDRRTINVPAYFATGRVEYTGPVTPPLPWERGWKDLVQCPPRSITRIIVPFAAKPGRYVWHCHILEHEANDMMRPFDVVV